MALLLAYSLLSACSGTTHTPVEHAESSPPTRASFPPPTRPPLEAKSEPVVAGTFDLAVVGEASGVALSVRTPGVLYVLDDGPGSTGVLAIDTTDDSATTVTVAGLQGRDTEGLAVGRCSATARRTCLFIGDIGNNLAEPGSANNAADVRPEDRGAQHSVNVWRVREPDLSGDRRRVTVEGDTATYTYPDDPVNAEALLVERGLPHLVTKPARRGDPAETPRPRLLGARRFADGRLRDFGAIDLPEPDGGGLAAALVGNVVTGGEVVGDLVVLRTYDHVLVYTPPRPDARLRGLRRWTPQQVDTPRMRQGEAVTMDGCGLWLTSEQVDSIWLVPWRTPWSDDEQEPTCPTGSAHS